MVLNGLNTGQDWVGCSRTADYYLVTEVLEGMCSRDYR